jgi:hypothetical protein
MRLVALGATLLVLGCQSTPVAQVRAPADTLTSESREILDALAKLRDSAPAAHDTMQTIALFGAQITLAHLGYGTKYTGELDAATREATETYERAHHLAVTGNPLTPVTFNRLMADKDALETSYRLLKPGMKFLMTDNWDRGWVHASGGWRATNSKLMADVQAAQVDCDRNTGGCRMTLAQVVDDRLELSEEIYQISSWDRAEIRAMKDYLCARYALVINRAQKSVEATRTTLSQGQGCQHMDAESVRLELYDGWEITRNDRSFDLMSLGPRVRAILVRDSAPTR